MKNLRDEDIILTIAVPVYNKVSTIQETIESCLNQSDLKQCEVLVVDNFSTDGTYEILLGISDRRLRIIRNDKTSSLYANHNICMKNAMGDYVLFCHGDDTLQTDAVKIIKKNLLRRGYPRRFVMWGHSLFRDYASNLKRFDFSTGVPFAGERAILPFLCGGLTPSGTCFSRSMLNFGGFSDSEHPLASSDVTTMVKLALSGFVFEMIPNILYYRTEAGTAKGIETLDGWSSSYNAAMDVYWASLTSKEKIRLARGINSFHYHPPLLFLYFMAPQQPQAVFRSAMIHVVLRPWIAGFKIYWRTLFLSLRLVLVKMFTGKILKR